MILLPNGTNQSFNSDRYEDKLEHYIKENTFAQTLHPNFYNKNPNFNNNREAKELGFVAHPHLSKENIEQRKNVIEQIVKRIWSSSYFDN